MNGWPDGWTEEPRRRTGDSDPTRVMGHVQRGGGAYPPPPAEPPLPPGLSPRRAAASRHQGRSAAVPPQPRYDDGYGGGRGGRDGHGGHGGAGGHGGPGGAGYAAQRPDPVRRIKRGLVAVLVFLLVVTGGTWFWAGSQLRREVDLEALPDRPEAGEGTNYLIVGSDSREGLSDEDRKNLHTGRAAGKRTDSMMILHVGDNGNTLMSLPRDSWVTIPAFTGSESGKQYGATQNKLNAAFSMDGAGLLAQTVEFNTGLRIDHYVEIGFAGFANIVDALGGVEMCLDKPVKDKNSGADLKAGCQELDGAQSLAFVRQRYQEAEGDLGRTKNQQKFLSALANQAAGPGTVLNPFTLYPTLNAGLETVIVDEEMGVLDLASMFWAMKGVSGGEGQTLNVPVANPSLPTPRGSAVQWDMAKAKPLFEQLKNDEKVTVTK
ncbi:LCP family protein [Streptomyces sp. HB2AG]|uniref:LCP family protein n=1 Tax=Streptomyces sp. HB2AG TaxID=2983400 RepID=UPI0022AA84EE|nr:LCP family protein [Streptomyces sp. HB2AG]MCZ2526764.1 LCP family protein [Streptomyces sp. HB2AG]